MDATGGSGSNSPVWPVIDRRWKIPNLDPPAGIFANHCRRLFKCEFVSLDPRLESRKSAMDNSFTLGSNEEADHGRNFLQSFDGKEGSYDPMLKQIDIPGILHMQGRLFESRGCLLLTCRDDIDSREFTIYEMVKGCSMWTVRDDIGSTEFTIYEMMKGSSVWSVRSNQTDDDDVEFIPHFLVDPNLYEFISSFASV
ncbi:hypothetical protein Tco_0629428 [Tanacetum coccineum]|uniref:F-box protein n=1 Tax=Tanacetum coccineum TaxID=301880 RepID=A0ABQ4WT27_9ASTR